MKLYKTQKLNEVMENVKPKTILFFYIKNGWYPFLPNTEIDFVKAVIMNENGFKKIVHCNRFKLVQSAETNEWTIYNGENTDYEFLYAFEKLDEETYKLLGNVEVFELKQRFSYTPYNEREMISLGMFNTNIILSIHPYHFSDMKYISGDWYKVELDNSKKLVYGTAFINEETYKKIMEG